MKILGIRATGRPNGNSSIILNELLRPAREQGFETETLNLSALNLKHCTGCFGCNNAELKCIIKDDLELVKDKINEADGIVLVSPCYALGAASVVKTVLDRLAAWALDTIARSPDQKKFGVAVSVGGGIDGWYTLQRVFMSEFLGFFNCHIVGQYTVHDIGLKGEILLYPSILKTVRDLGGRLVEAVGTGWIMKSEVAEDPNHFICPNCFNDTFQVRVHGIFYRPFFRCPVCNWTTRKAQPLQRLLHNSNEIHNHRFTPEEAGVHFRHIGHKINNAMLQSEEIGSRLAAYVEKGELPDTDYIPAADNQETEDRIVTWEPEAEITFEQMVPKAFQGFVKKAVEKKALAKGFNTISKELFLTIKKESGN